MYSGIDLAIKDSDGKRYSLNLKMDPSKRLPGGGMESAIEYKFYFESVSGPKVYSIAWDEFHPSFRGRDQPDAPPLDPSRILYMSIMCASNFDMQKGDFSLELESIVAQ